MSSKFGLNGVKSKITKFDETGSLTPIFLFVACSYVPDLVTIEFLFNSDGLHSSLLVPEYM